MTPTAPILVGHGAITGDHVGSSPAVFTVTGHVPVGTQLALWLLGTTGSTVDQGIAITDSKGNDWSAQGVNNFENACAYTAIHTALVAGDTVTVTYTGTASFYAHSVEMAGVFFPADDGPVGGFQSGTVYDSPLNGGFATEQEASGLALAGHSWSGAASPVALADWTTIVDHVRPGGQEILIGFAHYNYAEFPSSLNRPRQDYQSTGAGTGGGFAMRWGLVQCQRQTTFPDLQFASLPGTLVDDATFGAGGKRLDYTLDLTSEVLIDAGSTTSECLDGSTIELALPWDFKFGPGGTAAAGVGSFLFGLLQPGKPLGLPLPPGPGATGGGVLPNGQFVDWQTLVQLWPYALPPDAEVDTGPLRLQTSLFLSTTLTPPSSQACDGSLVVTPLAESTALYAVPVDVSDQPLDTSCYEVTGDLFLDGVQIVSSGPLRYDGVIAGRQLEFRLPPIDMPAMGAAAIPMPFLVPTTLNDGVWNTVACTFSLKVTFFFGPAPIYPPPIIINPPPIVGPGGTIDVVTAPPIMPGPGSGGEIRQGGAP